MSIQDRPFAGTWAPNRRKTVRTSPDALVYLNGDTSLPGCRDCHHRIDIQPFVTAITADAGVEPGSMSATISMSIPRHYGDSIFRDGNSILREGLEVHIYFKGHFPMAGLNPEMTNFAGVNANELPQYPVYQAFHGVVTSVSKETADGAYQVSLTCNSMLHFWQYLKVSTNGSFFGTRPVNSRVQMSLVGNNFTGIPPTA